MNFLVTGGAGFIGRLLLRYLRTKYSHSRIIVLDKMGIGSDENDLKTIQKIDLYKIDISNKQQVEEFCTQNDMVYDCIFHLAAESHVDRSIENPVPFVQSNVVGTFNMLFEFKNKFKKFVHVSTDEVYGSLNSDDKESVETDPLKPSSIYSSTKASSDLIVMSTFKTYNFPVIISRCCNNFGMGQHDEKFIPTVIKNAKLNKQIPIYGNGKNMREWIFAGDHAFYLLTLFEQGQIGEIYNIGSGYRLENITLAKHILKILDKPENLLHFVEDRKGHDICYKLNSDKIKQITSVMPYTDNRFDLLLRATVHGYLIKNNML